MRVVFFVRADAPAKSGGDLVQANQYIAALKRRKVVAQLVRSPGELRGASLLHVFNLDRPWDALPLVGEASKLGIPIVLSTLLHPREAVVRYQRERSFPVERLLLSSGVSPDLTERVKAVMRGLVSRAWPAVKTAAGLPLRAAQAALWRQCSGAQVLSHAERRALEERGFIFEGKISRIVRNGVFPPSHGVAFRDDTGIPAFVAKHPKFCLVGGRIEPRKNQCVILELGELFAIPIIFAGAINERHAGYARRFKELIKGRENILHVGEIPRGEFDSLLNRCHLHVSASLFEVSSLVDLEARAAGAWIVSSKCGYAAEFLDEAAFICDPWSPPSIAVAIKKGWSQTGRAVAMPVPTWDLTGEALLKMYAEIIGN